MASAQMEQVVREMQSNVNLWNYQKNIKIFDKSDTCGLLNCPRSVLVYQ